MLIKTTTSYYKEISHNNKVYIISLKTKLETYTNIYIVEPVSLLTIALTAAICGPCLVANIKDVN